MESIGWSSRMHWLLDEDDFYDPSEYFFLEGILQGRYVVFVITATHMRNAAALGMIWNLLAQSMHWRPTVLLDASGILKKIPSLLPFVMEFENRGHFDLMDDLRKRFGIVINQSHVIEQKREELANRLGQSIRNVFESVPAVFVFGPSKPKDPKISPYETMLWWLRGRIYGKFNDGKSISVTGEELDSIGISEMNPALKEKLFAKHVLVIVLLCASPGAIAEASIISQYEELAGKTIIAIDRY
jgi:hypothetical protein